MFEYQIVHHGKVVLPDGDGLYRINGLKLSIEYLTKKLIYGVVVNKLSKRSGVKVTRRKGREKAQKPVTVTKLYGSGYDFDLANREHMIGIGK